MKEKKSTKERGTSVSANSLIWFGTGVSIAEILIGTCLAPLEFGKGLAAIVLDHIAGRALLFMAGLIGGYIRRSSVKAVKISFRQKGNLLFCGLDVLQLVGWTSIMIYDGGLAANGISNAGLQVWYLVTGGLILVWLLTGIGSLRRISTAAMTAPFALTLILCRVIFTDSEEPSMEADSSLSFGAAVELSVAMPLFWLPLINDYIREAEKPFRTTTVSALVYGLVSCFMYVIGMGAAIYMGGCNISVIVVRAGLGATGPLIIVLSTVTTTFLNAYSADVSSVSITHRIEEKWAAVAVTLAGTTAAMAYPMDNIADFLYLIDSMSAPMIAIQIADYFIVRQNHEAEEANLSNLLIWLAGFMIYHMLTRVDTPVGNTLPDMAVTVVLCVMYHRVISACCTLPRRESITKV